MSEGMGKAQIHRVQLFEETGAQAFEDAVNAWFETAGEIILIDVQFSFDGANYVALIVYQQ